MSKQVSPEFAERHRFVDAVMEATPIEAVAHLLTPCREPERSSRTEQGILRLVSSREDLAIGFG